jgi:hypothetical protein
MSVSGDVSSTMTLTTRSTAELIVLAGAGSFRASPRSAAEPTTAAARPDFKRGMDGHDRPAERDLRLMRWTTVMPAAMVGPIRDGDPQ